MGVPLYVHTPTQSCRYCLTRWGGGADAQSFVSEKDNTEAHINSRIEGAQKL
jgi:hypothetical protein